MADTRDDPWAELYDALPRGWIVGRPPYDERSNKWRLYSYDRRLKHGGAAVQAEAETEEAAIREMARLLRRGRPRSK